MSDRPRLGISACLLGEPVRYNAGHKRHDWLADVLGPLVEWVAVCPEVEAGFGTPREAMHLVLKDGGRVALMTIETARDLTHAIDHFAERRIDELALANLDGYVFKADSPSCGIGDVPVVCDTTFDAEIAEHAEPHFSGSSANSAPDGVPARRGLFAAALMTRLPDLPVADERRLADPDARQQFVERVLARHRARKIDRMPDMVRSVDVVRVRRRERAPGLDRAATEEPLEIRLHDRPFAVIMRTPGADRELAAGFLLAERVIAGADDLGTIKYCTDAPGGPDRPADAGPFPGVGARGFQPSESRSAPTSEAWSNIVNVTLANGSAEAIDRLMADRRNVTTNSSCGLCGRRTIEALAADVAPIRSASTVAASTVSMLPERLRARQSVFDETGGLHAAGLFTPDGEVVDVAEDVGRHNAVDKIVGRMLMREALPLSNHLLCVSGRTSFEIVQKALVAGIPILAAVSAPSTLAIELAQQCGVTLIGFVRGDSFNIYAHPERIEA